MDEGKRMLYHALVVPLLIVFAMYLVFAMEHFGHYDFRALGIYPRKAVSLAGIITMPFVHSDFEHIMANTPAFLFLSVLIFYDTGGLLANPWFQCGYSLVRYYGL